MTSRVADPVRGPAVLPVALRLDGRPVLVVGAVGEAVHKIAGLLDAGASVSVVARRVAPEVAAWSREELVAWHARDFEASDVIGMRLVVATTGVSEVDALVAAEARRHGALVNSADRPEECDVFLTATARWGPVVLSVTSSGRSPALAAVLRDQLSEFVPEGVGELAERIGMVRAERQLSPSSARVPWRGEICPLLAEAAAADWDAVDRRLDLLRRATS